MATGSVFLKNDPVPLSFRCGRGELPGSFPAINV
jgi:hypothetical protein